MENLAIENPDSTLSQVENKDPDSNPTPVLVLKNARKSATLPPNPVNYDYHKLNSTHIG